MIEGVAVTALLGNYFAFSTAVVAAIDVVVASDIVAVRLTATVPVHVLFALTA